MSRRFLAFNHRRLSLTLFPRTVPGASALAFSLLAVRLGAAQASFRRPQCRRSAGRRERGRGRSNPLAPCWSICAPARVRPRPRSRARAPAADSLPTVGPRPVRSRRPGDDRQAARRQHALAAAPFGGIEVRGGADRGECLAEFRAYPRCVWARATFENTPLPPRRSEEFQSEGPRRRKTRRRASVRLGENAPENRPCRRRGDWSDAGGAVASSSLARTRPRICPCRRVVPRS